MHGWRPYSDFHRERMRAHKKHEANGRSMEEAPWADLRWLPVLVEEVGEVARCICDGDGLAHLREELVRVGAMTAAWIEAIDAALVGRTRG